MMDSNYLTRADVDKSIEMTAKLCFRFEGCYLKPYICPAGVATIGVGTTRYPDGRIVSMADMQITKDQAMFYLYHDIREKFMPGVLALCTNITTPEMLAALTDFAYNLGLGRLKTSTLRKKINAREWAAVPHEFRKWVNGGGRKLQGLVLRREAEIALLKQR